MHWRHKESEYNNQRIKKGVAGREIEMIEKSQRLTCSDYGADRRAVFTTKPADKARNCQR